MRSRTILIAVTCIALVGCAAGPHTIPLAIVTPPPLVPQIDKSVLLVIDSALKTATGTSGEPSWYRNAFFYRLGDILPSVIGQSLSEQFKEVVVAGDDSRRASFDVVVTPTLVRFVAVVPWTVFLPTETSVKLAYVVYDVAADTGQTLSARGTQIVGTARDELLLERLTQRLPSRTNSVNGWVAPEYTSDAGRDAMIAILHAVDDLNIQLKNVFGE